MLLILWVLLGTSLCGHVLGRMHVVDWRQQQNTFGAAALMTVAQMNVTLDDITNDTMWWEVEKTSDDAFYKLQANRIFLTNQTTSNDTVHSCYRYLLYDKGQEIFVKTNSFCAPAIILTGYKKCSTSALYALFTQYPNTLEGTGGKENCAFTSPRSLIEYFDSLPQSVQPGQLIINGCIDPRSNIMIRNILHNPNGFYVGITRNYADWLWSAYNYWCDGPYDKRCNAQNHWVIPGIHARSPEIFRDMVNHFTAGHNMRSPAVMVYCCDVAEVMYGNFVKYLWNNGIPVENTMFVASEDLETNPERAWLRIAQAVGLNHLHAHITKSDFQGKRYNTNSQKGAGSFLNVTQYTPGLYMASDFKPMLNESRQTLDGCWRNQDCVFSSLVTGYNYSVCAGIEDKMSRVTDANLKKFVEYYKNPSSVVPFLKRMQQSRN